MNKKYMDLYYIRHGDPNYETTDLTEKGWSQARKTGVFFHDVKLDKIFAGTISRAYHTAVPTAEDHKMEIIPLDWAREDIAWEGITGLREDGHKSWIFAIDKYLKRMKKLQKNPLWYRDEMFGEKVENEIERVQKEINNFFSSLHIDRNRSDRTYKSTGKNPKIIAFFCHGGIGTEILSSILCLNYPYFIHHYEGLTCCGIVKIRIYLDGKTKPRVLLYNYFDHLHGELTK